MVDMGDDSVGSLQAGGAARVGSIRGGQQLERGHRRHDESAAAGLARLIPRANHARPLRCDMSDPEPGSSSRSTGKAPLPANLRFQRRISERAFSETSYRDGTMEYPGAGTSPWASSPEASRTSFSNDVPREDLPGPALQHEGGTAGATASTANGAEQNYSTYGQPGSWSPEQQHQWQHEQAQQQHHQEPQQQPVKPPGEENRRPQSARYHGVPP